MSETIQFLEAAGRDPTLSAAGYATAVAALPVPAAHRQALLERDPAALNALLDGRPQMICMVNAPLEDEPHEPDPDDGDGDGVPDENQPPLQN